MNDDEPRRSFWYPTVQDGEFLVCDDEAGAVGWRAPVMVSARIWRDLLGYQSYPEVCDGPAPLNLTTRCKLRALLRDAHAAKSKADLRGLWEEFGNGVQVTTFGHDPEDRKPWWPETLRLYRDDEDRPRATAFRID